MLTGKRILLGITGGIAAYKIPLLVRALKKLEADVQCIMTPASLDFVSPLTLATLSGNPVCVDFWNHKDGTWTNHVELGLWGDLFLIAPMTANTLSKMVHGGCDNLLLATYLSAKCPIMVAPAMDLDMYAHPTTDQNLIQLQGFGVDVIPAEHGFLASGLEGQGRMPEPTALVEYVTTYFKKATKLSGKTILVTAGPTYEAIDPVRFIGNHSSGKMGFEIAKALLSRDANVVLVTGPTHQQLVHPKLKRIDIISAQELLAVVQHEFPAVDGGIFSAAVADYRPATVADEKIKKQTDEMVIRLVKNPDVLGWAGRHKSSKQFLIGFALETNNAIEYGKEKLAKKNLDRIVVNSLSDSGAGFGHDTNKITILGHDNIQLNFELSSKAEAASNIVDQIVTLIK
jgi:phosphopantothenoylcysteine decarboxylase / phosphopantothenate---cysteine ligase